MGMLSASYYTNRASSLAYVGDQYSTCEVSVGRVCAANGSIALYPDADGNEANGSTTAPGADGNEANGSTTVHYLSAMLLFAASALVIIFSEWTIHVM